MIRALHDRPRRAAYAAHLNPADFASFLVTYASMHTRGSADGVPASEPFIAETFHGDDGYWIARRLMAERKQSDWRRGDHYLHSTFCDLVLEGLVGLHVVLSPARRRAARDGGAHDLTRRPAHRHGRLEDLAPAAAGERSRGVGSDLGSVISAPISDTPLDTAELMDDPSDAHGELGRATLVVDPLFAPHQLAWFSVSSAQIHGHDVAVQYDEHGEHYGNGVGIAVWLDGRLVADAPTLTRLAVDLGALRDEQ